jgi:hypothetical protein
MRNRALSLLLLAIVLVLPVHAANPVFGGVVNRTAQWPPQAGPSYGFGGPFELLWQAVPTTLTDLSSSTGNIHIIGMTVCNFTGGAIVLTWQTKDASPLSLPLAGSIAANTCVDWNRPSGLGSTGGASMSAASTGLSVGVVWTN